MDKVIGWETGEQFDLAFAGCAEIVEDRPDLPVVMFKLDILVLGRCQRLRSGLVFLQATPEEILCVEQVARILLNRPFAAALYDQLLARKSVYRILQPGRSTPHSSQDVGIKTDGKIKVEFRFG